MPNPKSGEIYESHKGAVRCVRSVDEWTVTYDRPAPADPQWITIELDAWNTWVESARKTRSAAVVETRDWGYLQ